MIMTNKILAVALIAALAGGSLGAIVMHSRDSSNVAATTPNSDATYSTDGYRNAALTTKVADEAYAANIGASEFSTAQEQKAYKMGFADGFRGCTNDRNLATTQSRVTYRNAPYASTSRASRVYYDYGRPRGRTFWQKHRDKLTMAIGTGAGAALGGLIGGKKGAGIGALAGLGGSALYTYKIRKRHHRY